jgi:guanylate kinase
VTPRLVVLSAPSGGGKTTIANAMRDEHPERFAISVSATTRAPRPGERDGEAYHFLTRPEFERRVTQGEFLEHATYAGRLYGTLRSEVERGIAAGKHVLLDIEVDGARQVRRLYPDAITIFILPSDPKVLLERLSQRRTEAPAEIERRLERTKYELRHAGDFDRFVRNDDLARAVADVVSIIDAGGGYARAAADVSWIKTYTERLIDANRDPE